MAQLFKEIIEEPEFKNAYKNVSTTLFNCYHFFSVFRSLLLFWMITMLARNITQKGTFNPFMMYFTQSRTYFF